MIPIVIKFISSTVGECPLFTIEGSIPGVSQAFLIWAESWVKTNRESGS